MPQNAEAAWDQGEDLLPEKKPTQRDLIIDCAKDVNFWHDPDAEAYATLRIGTHREHHRIRSRLFRDWLSRQFYLSFNSAPSAQAMEDALRVLEAKAKFDGAEHTPAVRVGEHNGDIYIDLTDKNWRAIQVTTNGWQIVIDPPVKFIRPRGQRPLASPVAGGSVDELRKFVNVKDDDDFKLLVAWLVMTLRPRGPYPVLMLAGEQGSGKSCTARVLRSLVDPNKASLRSPPREERDLLIAARNSWCVVYDNLSRIPEWLSDSLCRIATGGGYSARQLYSDAEEIIFEAMRPVIVNGIPDLATRPDLADRSIITTLPPMTKTKRLTERQFWQQFDASAGRILGALLDAVSAALRHEDDEHRDNTERMSDFCSWIMGAERTLGWPQGSFMAAYRNNRDLAVQLTIEADVVADGIRGLMNNTDNDKWEGTASELLAELTLQVPDIVQRTRDWPKAPNVLSGRITRAAPGLRRMGIDVIPRKLHGRRHFTFMKTDAALVMEFDVTKKLEPTTSNSVVEGIEEVEDPKSDTFMKKVEGKDLTHRYQAGPERECRSDHNKLVGSDPGSDHGDQDQNIATSRASDKPLLNRDIPDTGSDRCDGSDDLHPHSYDDEAEEWEADL